MTTIPVSPALWLPARDRWLVVPDRLPIEVTEETAQLTVAEFFGQDHAVECRSTTAAERHDRYLGSLSVLAGQWIDAE
ncbi:hypothetical protein [Streptosporangium sp. NPDC087985]|uniref:hypothetical protein n=1 Tax=Streptosporangium sp. NPDC087985 TaxID=3366196 RepID=UPI0037F47CDB